MNRAEASSTNPDQMRVSGPTQLTRPARVLLGWLNDHDGAMMLGGRDMQSATNPEHITKVRLAREAVSRRNTILDQSGVVSAPPDSIADYIAAFNDTDAGRQMVAEG